MSSSTATKYNSMTTPKITTKHDTILKLLEDLISQSRNHSITLVICSSKSDFLDQLRTSIESWQPPTDEIPASQENLEEMSEPRADSNNAKHAFLTPTLHLLASSQNIHLVFCPSINTLRAYLTTLGQQTSNVAAMASRQLMICNFLALHHSTSEFSLQGLSRTFAAVVSFAHKAKLQLRLVECQDIRDPTDPSRGPRLWDAEIPLLSGSVRIGGSGASWAGRTIAVRRVVERWFEFEDGG